MGTVRAVLLGYGSSCAIHGLSGHWEWWLCPSQPHGDGCGICLFSIQHITPLHSKENALSPALLTCKLFTQRYRLQTMPSKKQTKKTFGHMDLRMTSSWIHRVKPNCPSERKSKKTEKPGRVQTQPKPAGAALQSPAAQKSASQGMRPMDGHCCHQEQNTLFAFREHRHSSPCSLHGYFSQKSLNPAQVLDVKCRITSPELNHWLL